MDAVVPPETTTLVLGGGAILEPYNCLLVGSLGEGGGGGGDKRVRVR